jgi:hypothetical protein
VLERNTSKKLPQPTISQIAQQYDRVALVFQGGAALGAYQAASTTLRFRSVAQPLHPALDREAALSSEHLSIMAVKLREVACRDDNDLWA